MRVKKWACLGLVAMTCAIAAPLWGQSAPLEEKQKAVMVVDIRMDQIRDSDVAKAADLQDQITQSVTGGDEDKMDPTKMDRIFAALSAPENMEQAQAFAMNEVPIEFFVQFKFKDGESATQAMNKLLEKNPPRVDIEGKTFYESPDDGKTPKGLLLHQEDETTIEMGTRTYILHPNREVFTSGLVSALNTMPADASVKVALDTESAGPFLQEAAQFGKSGNPATDAYLDLIDNVKNLRISMDFSGDHLLTIQATGVDEDEAEEFRSGLDSLLGTAKMFVGMQANSLKEQQPEVAAVLQEVLDSMIAVADGTEVSVKIVKPAKLDEAIKTMKEVVPMGAP